MSISFNSLPGGKEWPLCNVFNLLVHDAIYICWFATRIGVSRIGYVQHLVPFYTRHAEVDDTLIHWGSLYAEAYKH